MNAASVTIRTTRTLRGPTYALGNLAIVLVYVMTGELTRLLEQPAGPVPLVWAPSGIGFALILLYGRRWVPGVALGTFLVVLIRYHPVVALFVAVVEVLEAAATYGLLRHALRFRPQLDRVRDVLLFVAVNAGLSLVTSILGSVIGARVFMPIGWAPPESFIVLWSTWWWTNLSGDLIVAPALLTWLARTPVPSRRRPWEAIVLGAVALLMTVMVLASWIPSWVPADRAPYYLLPMLLWAGVRYGPRGAATASLVVSVSAIVTNWLGFGPFPQWEELQVFVAVSSITALLLSALAQERVREVERRGAIQDAALDAIITIDDRGRVLELNPAAEQLFAVRQAEVIGKDLAQVVIPPRLRERYYRGFERFVTTGVSSLLGSRYRAMAWRASDGNEFPVEIAVTRVPLDEELVLTGFVRDTSAEVAAELVRREAEANLERKVAERTVELRKSVEQGDRLLREIHHRVKNNLQVISSLLNLQAATTTSERARSALLESQNRVAAMALVHQLLYQSKDIETVDCAEYLRGLAQRLSDVYNVDSARITIDVDAQPVRLDIDRAIPCGVIVNELVTNSLVHAFPQGRTGTVTISLARLGDTIELAVRDDGVGMPADLHPESATTFGLTLVHALATELGGTLVRLPDRGTAIRIAFPAKAPAKSAA